ncbi:MAG: type II toxin-antitoxin system VapB family antitoxin [Methylococcales bacterium]|nr:type II toxin-antitoxin system VapB family antitoxin [Methylococcales bacterium]
MRTNIAINDVLLNAAILLTGIKTKTKVVELGGYCLENDVSLLFSGRYFEPFVSYLPLKSALQG